MTKSLINTLIIVSLLVPAWAQTIALRNPSMEAVSLGNGAVTRTIANWSVTGGTTNSDVGVYNPTSEYSSGIAGNNILYMVTNTAGKRNNVIQNTTTRMVPGTTYTLRVNVGQRAAGSRQNFAGYQVALRCGGRVVRSTGSLNAPQAAGTMGEVVLSYTATAADTGVIAVQFGSGTNAGAGAAVDFDNVRLTTGSGTTITERTWGGTDVAMPAERHVKNTSFERVVLDDGRTYQTFAYWDVNGNTNNSDLGMYNPTNEYTAGVSGNNILYMVTNTPGRRHNVVQTLSTAMVPGKTYRLTVDVGQRGAGSRPNFAGYQICLRSGGRLVRQVSNLSAPSRTPGQFGTVVLEYVARAGDTGAIGIQLGSGTNAGPGAAVDFDNVSLTIDGTSYGGTASQTLAPVSDVAVRSTGNNVLNVKLTNRQVVQRSLTSEVTSVKFEGTCTTAANRIQIRVINRANGTRTGWKTIDRPSNGRYAGTYDLPPGWYRVRLRALNSQNQVLRTISVNRLGVGDVFITAGQSNSANFGQTKHTAGFDSVSWCNVTDGSWSHATDTPGNPSQSPSAAGGGSYWPILGDMISQKDRVPCAFAVVGDGGSPVSSWRPDIAPQDNYPNLRAAIGLMQNTGFRAILWHQGEAEIGRRTPNANYTRDLRSVIAQSREDAGWNVPWYVSRVHMVTAQNQVIASDSRVHAGPATDSLTMAGGMRYDRVHWSTRALPVVAEMWYQSVYGNSSNGRGNGALSRIGGNVNLALAGASGMGSGSLTPVTPANANTITIVTESLGVVHVNQRYNQFIQTSGASGARIWEAWLDDVALTADAEGNFLIGRNLKLKIPASGVPVLNGNYYRTDEELRNYTSGDVNMSLRVKITDATGATGEKTFDLTIRYPDPFTPTVIGLGYFWNEASRDDMGNDASMMSQIYRGLSNTREIFNPARVTYRINAFGFTSDYAPPETATAGNNYRDMVRIFKGVLGQDDSAEQTSDRVTGRVEFNKVEVMGIATGTVTPATRTYLRGSLDGPTFRETYGCNMSQFVYSRYPGIGDLVGTTGLAEFDPALSVVAGSHIQHNVAAHELGHSYGAIHEECWYATPQYFSVMRAAWHPTNMKNFLSNKRQYNSNLGWMGDDDQSNIDYVQAHKNIIAENLD